jgi:hypothetical protein
MKTQLTIFPLKNKKKGQQRWDGINASKEWMEPAFINKPRLNNICSKRCVGRQINRWSQK